MLSCCRAFQWSAGSPKSPGSIWVIKCRCWMPLSTWWAVNVLDRWAVGKREMFQVETFLSFFFFHKEIRSKNNSVERLDFTKSAFSPMSVDSKRSQRACEFSWILELCYCTALEQGGFGDPTARDWFLALHRQRGSVVSHEQQGNRGEFSG